MESINFLKNSFFYTIASVLQGFIGFLLLPLYTRYLSPLDYGVLALVTSFIGILASIITLQIHAGVPRFVIKFQKDENRAKIYFTSIFLLISIILVLSCVIINIFGETIVRIVFSNKNNISYAPFFQIGTLILLPTLLASVGMLLLQTLEYGHKFLLVTIIQVVANLFFGLFFVIFLKTGVSGVLWAQFIGAACGLIFTIWFIRDWFKLTLQKLPIQDIRDSLRYSLPIIPHTLSIYIYMQSNRLILQRYVPLADIGVYSIADTFASILLIIINSANSAYTPIFLKLAEDNRRRAQDETKKFIEIWWVVIMVIFMGYLLLSGYLVRLMTRPSFYPSIPLIPILAFAYIFRGLYCFNTNSLFFIEKTKYIPVITVTAAVLNVLLNLIFIPKFGIFAAAWITVISYFITFIVSYYFSRKFFPIFYPWKNMSKIAILLFSSYIIVIFWDALLHQHILLNLSFRILILSIFIIMAILVAPKEYLNGMRGILNSFKNKLQLINFSLNK